MPDKSRSADEQQLARYLLGLLPEQEAEKLDEATIVDDDIATRLRMAENDLVDDYVSGALSGDMLERFESRYLASPRRRANVTFAEKFLGAVDRTARAESDRQEDALPAPTIEPDEAAGSASPSGRVHRLAFGSKLMAIAAVLLLAFGALLFETLHLRNDLQVARGESSAADRRAGALERRLAEARAAGANAAKELARVRETPPSRTPAQGLTTALVLLPQTRAAGPIPTIAIAAGAEHVAFELELESNDYYRYHAALMDPASNQTIWRSGQLGPVSPGGTPAIFVAIPARTLKPQHYALVVTARSAAANATVIGSYTFQVTRR